MAELADVVERTHLQLLLSRVSLRPRTELLFVPAVVVCSVFSRGLGRLESLALLDLVEALAVESHQEC